MGVAAIAMPQPDCWRRESPAPVMDHRRFGQLRAGFRRGSERFIWECLDLVPTPSGPADLEFEAGAWGPTEAHEQQLEDVTAKLDELSDAASQAIAAQFAGLMKNPQSTLEWQGARLSGNDGTFRLHFWCSVGPETLVTVSFEQWRATDVDLHD